MSIESRRRAAALERQLDGHIAALVEHVIAGGRGVQTLEAKSRMTRPHAFSLSWCWTVQTSGAWLRCVVRSSSAWRAWTVVTCWQLAWADG